MQCNDLLFVGDIKLNLIGPAIRKTAFIISAA
jgi:hypothetical protein